MVSLSLLSKLSKLFLKEARNKNMNTTQKTLIFKGARKLHMLLLWLHRKRKVGGELLKMQGRRHQQPEHHQCHSNQCQVALIYSESRRLQIPKVLSSSCNCSHDTEYQAMAALQSREVLQADQGKHKMQGTKSDCVKC